MISFTPSASRSNPATHSTRFLLLTRHTREDLSYTPTVPLARAAESGKGQNAQSAGERGAPHAGAGWRRGVGSNSCGVAPEQGNTFPTPTLFSIHKQTSAGSPDGDDEMRLLGSYALDSTTKQRNRASPCTKANTHGTSNGAGFNETRITISVDIVRCSLDIVRCSLDINIYHIWCRVCRTTAGYRCARYLNSY